MAKAIVKKKSTYSKKPKAGPVVTRKYLTNRDGSKKHVDDFTKEDWKRWGENRKINDEKKRKAKVTAKHKQAKVRKNSPTAKSKKKTVVKKKKK